jgi:hypothetical protein
LISSRQSFAAAIFALSHRREKSSGFSGAQLFPFRGVLSIVNVCDHAQIRNKCMNKLRIILAAAFCALALTSIAQDTNELKTDLGIFEAQTGVVIVKGYKQVGSISVGPLDILVDCKESAYAGTGQKADGVVVEIGAEQVGRERAYVDYDEIDSLLNGMDYINKINYDVTPLPGFEVTYTTKSGLRLIAYSVQRDGGIRLFLQYDDGPRISLSSAQLAQLEGFIGQAKTDLDSIRAIK